MVVRLVREDIARASDDLINNSNVGIKLCEAPTPTELGASRLTKEPEEAAAAVTLLKQQQQEFKQRQQQLQQSHDMPTPNPPAQGWQHQHTSGNPAQLKTGVSTEFRHSNFPTGAALGQHPYTKIYMWYNDTGGVYFETDGVGVSWAWPVHVLEHVLHSPCRRDAPKCPGLETMPTWSVRTMQQGGESQPFFQHRPTGNIYTSLPEAHRDDPVQFVQTTDKTIIGGVFGYPEDDHNGNTPTGSASSASCTCGPDWGNWKHAQGEPAEAINNSTNPDQHPPAPDPPAQSPKPPTNPIAAWGSSSPEVNLNQYADI